MPLYTTMVTRPEPWPRNLRDNIDQRVIDGACLWRAAEWGAPVNAWLYGTDSPCIKILLQNWETGGASAVNRLLRIVEKM